MTFRKGDGSAQPMEQLVSDTDWIRKEKKERNQLGMRLARSIDIIAVDLAESIETIR